MKLKDKISLPNYTLGEEITNAITHGFGALFSIAFLTLCVVFSAIKGNAWLITSTAIYGASSILLYLISTLYHSLKINNGKRVFRVLDHCSIFLLIAGTYTPYALCVLPQPLGIIIFAIEWSLALIGVILNSININKYKKVSMALYLIMGWAVIFSLKDLLANLNIVGLVFMFIGGLLYTAGAIFYGLGKRKKYMHSVFHIFVLAASILFFFSIFFFVVLI